MRLDDFYIEDRGALRAGLIALSVGIVASFSSLLSTFIWVPITMPCHELGHAMAYWLTGTPAVPSVFFTATFSSQSVEFSSFVTLVLLLGVFISYRRRRISMCRLLSVIAGLQLVLSYALPTSIQEQVCLAAGLVGESLWAPLFIYLAFEKLGSWWQLNGKMLALAATISLGKSLGEWFQVVLGMQPLPHGSLLFGENEGDTNRLIQQYGWSEDGLKSLFFALSVGSLVLASACVVSRLLRERRVLST